MTTAVTSRTTLGDLLDRLLDAGAVVAGDVVIGLADVELLLVDLRVLLTGVESARRRGGAPPEVLHHAPRAGAPSADRLPDLPQRVDLDDERPERGLVGLVLLLVDILRQLLEGQAVARLEGGSLTGDEAERLGTALRRLDARIDSLRQWLRDGSAALAPQPEGSHDSWR